MIRVAAVQVQTVDGEVVGNRNRALTLTRRAIEIGADLIVLPEAFTVGYCSTDLEPFAEDLQGPTVSAFIELAKHDHGVHIILGLIRRAHDGIYNSAILMGPEGIIGIYDKTHLFVSPSYPKLNEIKLFRPGRRLGLFDTSLGRLGVMVCYDGVHVECPRALVLGGADLLVWLNNRDAVEESEVTYPARYNKVPIVAVVRVGTACWGPPGEGEILCRGHSWIVNHRGEVLASGGNGEEVVWADMDLQAMRDDRWTTADLPIYLSRRPDLYGSLVKPAVGRCNRE